ncbi:myoD family inhibitor domain-containing protein 2-like [Diretmus argenteus]
MTGRSVVSGVRRLSTISEQEPEKLDTLLSSQDPLGGSEWGGSSFSLCSDNKYKNSSSRFSSDDSYQPASGDDCAAILLACLYCRFHDIVGMIPDACERAISRCFPTYEYIKTSSEKDQRETDCFSCNLDCDFCSSCQDTAELLELAMEISEVCYR